MPSRDNYNSIQNVDLSQFITNQRITIEQIAYLKDTIQKREVCQLILDGYITIEKFAALSYGSLIAIRDAEVRQLIIDKHITVAQFINLNTSAALAIRDPGVRKFIIEKYISMTEFNIMSFSFHYNPLENYDVRQFIIDGHITIEQFMDLNYDAVYALNNAEIRQFIIDKHITIAQFNAMCDGLVYSSLENANVRQFIIAQHISIEQFIALNGCAACSLKKPEVRQFIIDGGITIEQFSRLNINAASAIRDAGVRKFIIDGYITMEQFIGLHDFAAHAISFSGVRQLIALGVITMRQLIRISTYETARMIDDVDTARLILLGILNVDALIDRHRIQAMTPRRNGYGSSQSTHTASVHKSVSKSARKLFERYHDKIQGEHLGITIDSLLHYISTFETKVTSKYNGRLRDCNLYGINGLIRISTCEFKEPVSQISVRQLLALAYWAIHDESGAFFGEKDKTTMQLIEGFYEIERGKNIADLSLDNEYTKSSSICLEGTFNKIIEKLCGTHSDCCIIFVNNETITDKMRAVLIKYVVKHIKDSGCDMDLFCDKSLMFSTSAWNHIWNNIYDMFDAEIKKYFDDEEDDVKNQRFSVIDSNMEVFKSNLMLPSDVEIIRRKLPSKPEVVSKKKRLRLTAMYDTSLAVPCANQLKRSVSLDSVNDTMPAPMFRLRNNSI